MLARTLQLIGEVRSGYIAKPLSRYALFILAAVVISSTQLRKHSTAVLIAGSDARSAAVAEIYGCRKLGVKTSKFDIEACAGPIKD